MVTNVLSESDPGLIVDELLEAYLDFSIELIEKGNPKV